MSARSLKSLTLLLITLSACAVDPFEELPELEVPETINVPPINQKYQALQATLDGLLRATRVLEERCEVTELNGSQERVICRYPNQGGTVRFTGELDQLQESRDLFGQQSLSARQELRISEIELEDFRFMAYVGDRKLPTPQGCKRPVYLSGAGRLFASREELLVGMGEGISSIPLSSGGVYQGDFSVRVPSLDGEERLVELSFEEPGFYYRSDLTPLLREGARGQLEETLQASVIHSGSLKINGQRYSYQDVFIETLDATTFLNEGCDMDVSMGAARP